jgi:hypothetical protein
VLTATKVSNFHLAEFSQVAGETWTPTGSGRINPATTLENVLSDVSVVDGVACPVSEWGSPLWTGSKRDCGEARFLRGRSPYLDNAHRGTISDLARVFWVKVERYSAATNRALIRTLRDDELSKARKIDPVEGAWIEADLLYPLARGRDLGRYCLQTEDWYQIIPNTHYEDVHDEEDFAERYPCAYSYFCNYRDLLENRSTYRRYQKHLPFYVIYCVGGYSFNKWKVAWLEQQDPSSFRCAVVSEHQYSVVPNRLIVPDHKLYFVDASSQEEAHYLCAYLNAHPVRAWLGGFLHGKQIGTTIFEFMKVPRFDVKSVEHRRLAEVSLTAHKLRRNRVDAGYLSDELERELIGLVKRVSHG